MADEVKEIAEALPKAEKKPVVRREYRNDNWTSDEVAAKFAELSVKAIPEDNGKPWVKLADVGDACRVAGIAISRLVRATGGDRGMNPPADPLFQIVYFGRVRYVHPDVLTTGLTMLQKEGFASTPRKPRAKKEVDPNAPPKEKKAKAPKAAKKAATEPAAPGNPQIWGEQ